ncbi:reverse transcriptase family protein [Roseateles sp. P5_E8]
MFRLQSRKRLAVDVIGMPLPSLGRLAAEADGYLHFVRFTSGKQRNVDAPKPLLREVQGRLATLLNRIEVGAYLHSGQKQRSYLSNAMTHRDACKVVKLDIRHFYPSITRDRIWRFFAQTLQCSGDVAALLARLCTHHGSAPIGSPVSQVLAYHVVRPMLDELHRLALHHDLRFTCYVDDLSFSGDGADHAFLAAASAVVERHGFLPHAADCYAAGEDRLVTGVLLTSAGPRVPGPQLARVDEARQASAKAVGGAARLDALARLLGALASAAAIDGSFLAELAQCRLEWQMLRKRFKAVGARTGPTRGKPRLHPRRLYRG